MWAVQVIYFISLIETEEKNEQVFVTEIFFRASSLANK